MAGCKNNSFILLQFNDSEILQKFSNHFFKVETETLFSQMFGFSRKGKVVPLFLGVVCPIQIEVDFKKNNNQQLKIWNKKSYEKNYSEIC